MEKMNVIYIYHSCFVLEFDDCSAIIDFYRDTPEKWVETHLPALKKPLYVLCTHSHADHFNKGVLSWRENMGDIRYVFSQELLQSGSTKPGDAVYLKKTEVYEDAFLSIQAFGSTDIGGSFLIRHGQTEIFHAGDLNNWHWNEEAPKEEALTYENNYLCELELLAEYVNHVHLAMFPVDPRLGKDYMRGAEQFVSRIKTDYFLPMHFQGKYAGANALDKFARQHGCRFLALAHPGQSFEI